MKYNQVIPPLGKKLFYNWLKQQNLLHDYLINIEMCGTKVHLDTKAHFYHYINESFCWAKTSEGHDFWSRKHSEWYHYAIRYVRTHSHFKNKLKENRII